MNMKLLLIEDCKEDVLSIQEEVQGFTECFDRQNRSWHFSIEHLPGTREETIKDNTFRFYDESILDAIQNKVDGQTEENKVGLLLDIVLTRDELETKNKGNYPEAFMARKIYNRFHTLIPIYIITSVGDFYTRGEKIMGVDLSEQFVQKDVLLEFKIKSAIEKLQEFYVNWTEGDN